MKYRVIVTYAVKKELILEVDDGLDPWDPDNWEDIESEHDMDCNLYEVESAEEYEE